MPIPGLPTFAAGILTASQLNAIVTALEQKFAGGIVSGDIAWPFTAGGDINMAGHQLLNTGKFWNTYNVAERADGTTLQSVLNALSTDGGGLALIPANHTEAIPAGGISIPASVILQGHGPTSILQIDASASTRMVLVSGADNVAIRNLKLKGNTSVNHESLLINSSDNVRVEHVIFDSHGTDPQCSIDSSSENGLINACQFLGAGDAVTQVNGQLAIIAGSRQKIINNRFHDWSDCAVALIPASAQTCEYIIFASNVLERNANSNSNMTRTAAIHMAPNSAATAQGWIFVGNKIGGRGVGIGGFYCDASTALKGCIVADNDINTTLKEPAVLFYDSANFLVITGNNIKAAKGDGIVIGSDHGTEVASGSRTAGYCSFLTVSGNDVDCAAPVSGEGIALVMAVSTPSTGFQGAVSANRLRSAHANAFEIWNVGTTRPLYLTVTGNTCITDGVKKGFASFTDMGATNNGDIGTAAINWYFTMTGNIIPNTASGTDYTTGSNKTVVANNVT